MSDALGALVGGLFGLGSSAMQYGMQKDLMDYQARLNYKYGKKSALNQYTWQRQGLEKAGYNPLLALGGSVEGVANTGWTAGQSAPDLDPLTSALSVLQNKRETKKNQAEIENINTDTQIKENQRDLTSLELYDKDLQSNYYEQMAKINFDNSVIANKIKNEVLTQEIITSKNLDAKQKAEILQMTTGASANSSQAWYNMHRSLGFIDSDTETDGNNIGGNIGVKGIGSVGGNYGKTKSRTRTRSR